VHLQIQYIAFFLLWRPRRAGGRPVSCVRVWWPQRFAARLRPTSSPFLAPRLRSLVSSSPPLLCASHHRSLSLSSLLPQSRGPWALFAAAGLSLCRSRATASKTLATRSLLHLDRAWGRAGQGQLASLVVVQVRPLPNSPSLALLTNACCLWAAGAVLGLSARFRSCCGLDSVRAWIARLRSFCAPSLIRQITVAVSRASVPRRKGEVSFSFSFSGLHRVICDRRTRRTLLDWLYMRGKNGILVCPHLPCL